MKHLPTLINKIEQNLRQNTRNVPLLDIELMILVITSMIMKTIKLLGVEMWYLIRRPCTKISCRERNKKMKTQNTHFLMRSHKMEFQRCQEIKTLQQIPMINSLFSSLFCFQVTFQCIFLKEF